MSMFPGSVGGDATRRRIELVVEAHGRAAVDDLSQQLQRLQGLLQAHAAAYHTGTISLEDYLDRTKALSRETADAAQNLRLGEEALRRQNSILQMSAQQWRAASRALLEFSRGFEDFVTAGFIGALNNIPTMVYNIGQAMGVSSAAITGWTALISLGGTLTYALYKNWEEFKDLIGMPTIRDAADQMDYLSRKTHKSAEEQAELNRLRKEHGLIERMLTELSKEAKGTGHAVSEVVAAQQRGVTPGGMVVQESIRQALIAAGQGGGPSPEETMRLADIRAGVGLEALKAKVTGEGIPAARERIEKEVQAEVSKRLTARVDAIMAAAERGEEASIRQIAGYAQARPGAFPAGFGPAMLGTLPEARAAAVREKTAREFERAQVEQEAREAEADDRRAADQQFADQEAATRRYLQQKRQRQRQAAQEAKRAAAEGRKEETVEQREAKTLATRFEPAFGGRARQALEVNRARLEQMRGIPREMQGLQQDLDRMAGVEPVRGEREAMQQVAREIAETMRRARARDEQGRIMTAEQRARTATEIVRKAALDAEQRFMNMQMQNAGVANMMGISAQNQAGIAANEAAMADLIDSGLRQLNQAQHRIQQVERRMNPGRLQGGRFHP
jgi:hypothetical protein